LNRTRLRRAILDGARRAFLAEGYGVSMDRIAQESAVARKSIFNLFRSKDDLFTAVLSEAVVHSVDDPILDSDGNIERVLGDFAAHYLEIALSAEMIALSRLVYAEYQRFPTLIGRLSTSVFGQSIARVSHYFERLAASGRIAKLDPDMAAERFLSSVMGRERQRRLLGGPSRSPAQMRQYVEEAVRGFMHGIAVNRRKAR
jgi:AcrR family transcriptional regulator